MELLEKVRQKLSIANNVINIHTCTSLYIVGDIVNLVLDIGGRVDLVHNRDLEDFLFAIHDNDEYEAVVRVEELLIEKRGGVQDSQVDITLDVCNYLGL